MSGPNRAARRRKGKAPGMTYADQLARQRMIREAVKASADDARVKVETDIRCQRQLWLCVCSVADTFGFGPKRVQQFLLGLQKTAEEYDELRRNADTMYADEKMRQRAEQASGIKIEYLYEHEMAEARRINEAKGIHFDEKDQAGAAIADAMIGGQE